MFTDYTKKKELEIKTPSINNSTTINSYVMEKNTCFVVCVLYMIKQNKKLFEVIKQSSIDITFSTFLENLLNKEDGYKITKEDLSTLDNTIELGQQEDIYMLLFNIFTVKCNLIPLGFYYGSNPIIVNHDKEVVSSYITCNAPTDNNQWTPPPIIDFNLHETDVLNIQEKFKPEKKPFGHYIPFILNSPPFLIIQLHANQEGNLRLESTTVPEPYENSDGYVSYIDVEKKFCRLQRHGDIIIQEEIAIQAVNEEQEAKYKLTGFIVYELSDMQEKIYTAGGHFIPFYKLSNEWHANYYSVRCVAPIDSKDGVFKFKTHNMMFVRFLFYEKID